RNPANRDALPDCRLTQISAALTPHRAPRPDHATHDGGAVDGLHDARPDDRIGDRPADWYGTQPDDGLGARPDDCRPDGCPATPRSAADCPRRAAYTAWLADLLSGPEPPF
ncbi:hypothetical protein, partial [Streptomyces sp. NPDC089915]|uniref:hypothetical protein n=1 Tax=Streptomyces sp. NPDC089915 TaxID=3155186 RepID=UPI0034234D85